VADHIIYIEKDTPAKHMFSSFMLYTAMKGGRRLFSLSKTPKEHGFGASGVNPILSKSRRMYHGVS
jgi:hypothetical protein